MKRWNVLTTSTPNHAGHVSVRARHGSRVVTLDLPADTKLSDELFDQSMAFALDLHRYKHNRAKENHQ